MDTSEASRSREPDKSSKWLILTFVLTGLLLIAISVALPHDGSAGYLRELLKELGIVILSVFTVSFLYERLIAEKYLHQFLSLLRGQLQEGETNAAACARLGILEIFPTRDVFELKHPIANWTSTLTTESTLRIVAQSLFLLMSKVETIKTAIERGAQVEFCITSPTGPIALAEKISGLEVSDIQSAVSVFKKQIGEWVKQEKPPGRVELRYHQLPLVDSYLVLNSSTLRIAVWDLSFGRATTAKRILLLDPDKPLGADLAARYSSVWDESADMTVFKYEEGEVKVDTLTTT